MATIPSKISTYIVRDIKLEKTPAEKTIDFLRNEILGNDFFFETPYGKRLMTYADYTASGRSLAFIENYLLLIQRSYANTHTEDDVTGRTMTNLLHRAEHLIKRSFNAEENCYIIACGTGSTGAISKIQEILGLYIPPATKTRLNKPVHELVDEKKSPIIFVGPFEHHSNDVMWRETIGKVIEVELTADGLIDLNDLEKKVSNPEYKHRDKIGSFSAASNVTGVLAPVYDIAKILHKYGAIACFDFAACAPYIEINMNKDDESYLDAVFLSPHKFLGGPGSSGILVFNKRLYNHDIAPTFAAGGTVDFVSSDAYDFIKDVEAREKPGTPGILQTIKASLAITLKGEIGIDNIEEVERKFIHTVFRRLSKNPNIEILGNKDPDKRIAIFSLNIKHVNTSRFIHPKFVTRLLNDLFGIQSRAGCSCAGPYGHRLLNITSDRSNKYRRVIQEGIQCIKPGWIRVNFHYTLTTNDVNFILDALEFIAEYGHLFIRQYILDYKTGEWKHKEFVDKDLLSEPTIQNVLDMSSTDWVKPKPVDRKELYTTYMSDALRLAKRIQNLDEVKFSKFDNPSVEEIRFFNFVNIE